MMSDSCVRINQQRTTDRLSVIKWQKTGKTLIIQGLQLPVDNIQSPVGGAVKAQTANLGAAKPGGGINDYC